MNLIIKSAELILNALDNIFKDKITVSGVENIPLDRPVLFAANHFTRTETLFLPYICHKHTRIFSRSLADGKLFKGALGEYLTKTGTLATDDPNRDETIIGDLMTGENNWIIYPEGNMMKNKKVTFENGKFQLHLKDTVRSLFTGTASLAIKAELLRQEMLKNRDRVTCWKYFITEDESINKNPITIIPTNITYYPIRPGSNKLLNWLNKKKKGNLHPRGGEELEIEGNILAEANMHIHFAKPICVKEFISSSKVLSDEDHKNIDSEKRQTLVINYYRHKLTTAFMQQVYQHASINLDHIFALTLYMFPKTEVHFKELVSRVYLNIKAIQKLPDHIIHESMKIDVFKILAGKEFPALKSVFDLARKEGILIGDEHNEYFTVNRDAFENEHEFHNIRQKNIMKMLVNEMLLLDDVVKIAKTYSEVSQEEISHEIFNFLYNGDLDNFEKDYEKFHDEHSKPKSIGRPFFLRAEGSKLGVVLSHGYKAAPEEVKQLAEYLNKNGYNVYGVRLYAHGTSPSNMKHAAWQKWYDSYMRGVVALDQICDKVVFAGFSTGGLMSLYTAAQHPEKCYAVISINAAAKLQDIRVRFVKVVNFWNELVDKFTGEAANHEYIEDQPEFPNINYSINYIKGVRELEKLIEKTLESLQKVFAPSLVIQSPKDPIIKPESGQIIFKGIHARYKEMLEPDLPNHVVVRADDAEVMLFKPILDFINKVCHK